MHTIGERLRALRAEKNIKEHVEQKDVAQAVGISLSSLQKYEAGKVEVPKLKLEALARYYGVSAEYVRGETDERGGHEKIDIIEGPAKAVNRGGATVEETIKITEAIREMSKLHDDKKLTDEQFQAILEKIIGK